MATRRIFIERTLRQLSGGFPSDDSSITVNLVNSWLNDAIAVAAKANYIDSIKIDGVAYVNNSFYTTFKSLAVTKNENFLYRVTLPQIPLGIGADEGISTLEFKDSSTGQISYPVIWLTQNQKGFQKGMRSIPNKLLAYSEGEYVYVLSTIILSQYTATVTMVSGGDSTDLDSTLNVPSDYFGVMMDYLQKQLLLQRSMPVDVQNDGVDSIKTT